MESTDIDTNVYQCKKCEWRGSFDELVEARSLTYADEWRECPNCREAVDMSCKVDDTISCSLLFENGKACNLEDPYEYYLDLISEYHHKNKGYTENPRDIEPVTIKLNGYDDAIARTIIQILEEGNSNSSNTTIQICGMENKIVLKQVLILGFESVDGILKIDFDSYQVYDNGKVVSIAPNGQTKTSNVIDMAFGNTFLSVEEVLDNCKDFDVAIVIGKNGSEYDYDVSSGWRDEDLLFALRKVVHELENQIYIPPHIADLIEDDEDDDL